MKERLQKILSASGVCSRRKGEELIAQGLVTVNGQKAQVGDSADPEKDIIAVRGKPLGHSPPRPLHHAPQAPGLCDHRPG